jgi:predicted DNA-binding transcriptional regulator
MWLSAPVNANQTAGRNFMLVFDVKEYSTPIKEAVTYFINQVLQEGDRLIITSPQRVLGFSPDKLNAPKEKLIRHILEILKTDIARVEVLYRNTIKEMTADVQAFSVRRVRTPDSIMESYKQHRQTLLAIRGNLEERLMKFNKIFRRFKRDNRENHLLMIFQRELRPVPDKHSMDRWHQGISGVGFRAAEIFLAEEKQTKLDKQKLAHAFKYAKVRVHFLYLHGSQEQHSRRIKFIDNSRDIYNGLVKLAKATDGIILTTTTPAHFLKKVGQLVEGKVEVEVIDQTMKKENEK